MRNVETALEIWDIISVLKNHRILLKYDLKIEESKTALDYFRIFDVMKIIFKKKSVKS